MTDGVDRMNAIRRQGRWDELLLDAWQSDRTLPWVRWQWGLYFEIVSPFETQSPKSWDRVLAESSKLRRAPPVKHKFNLPVRVFVASYLRPLSELLWSRFDRAEALKLLRTLDTELFAAPKLRRSHGSVGVKYVIGIRHRDKGSDWKTVK
jgi:hypothetical protein